MFPLGTVLFPYELLPLHVFEDRYRAMMGDVLAADGRFGVVLIERGSEVGGGERRGGIGTMARIVESAELDDGRWVLVAVGERRIAVERWLPDEPYPQAVLVEGRETNGDTDLKIEDLAETERVVRRGLALARELGADVAPFDTPIDDDPVVGLWQLAAMAPLGPADRQRVLAAPSVSTRREALHDLVEEAIESFGLQLGEDPDEP